jgi:polar amino acid transport system permease protein
MGGWPGFAHAFLNPEVMATYLPDIAAGFVVTVELALVVVVTGIALGLALALLRAVAPRPVGWAIIVFVDLFRAVPPLVIIVLIYFALPAAGVSPSAFQATWASLGLELAAFAEEIFWAGLIAVPRGQVEAARSTGLTRVQTLAAVTLPQALRLAIPPLTNRTIAITKGTALGSVIGLGEILSQATSGESLSFNPSPLTLGAGAYLLLFIPIVAFGRWVETRFAWRP